MEEPLNKEDRKITIKPMDAAESLRKSSKSSAARRQWIITLLANVSVLSSGMGLGYPAISLSALTSPTNPYRLNEDQGSWFASINTITCPLGGLLGSYILDKFGRKFTIILINVLSIISWAIISWANQEDVDTMYNQLLIARLIIGISAGLSSSPVSVYAAEIAHPKLRGRLTVLTSCSIALGVLIIYFLGFLFQDQWRLIAKIALVICSAAFIISFFIPESPMWLARKNKLEDAENAYYKLNGKGKDDNDIDKELQNLIEQCKKPPRDENATKSTSLLQRLRRPNVYKPLGFLTAFFTFQQLCGIFVIVVYIGQLATSVGVVVNIVIFTVISGCCRFSGVLVSAFGCDKFGRRGLALISGLGISGCMMSVAVCLWYPTTKSHWYGTFFILVYVFISTIGFLTLPFTLMVELYPADVRGFATGLNVCYVYALSFFLIKWFPFISNALGVEFILCFISLTALVAVGFLYRYLPETKGKTLKELEEFYK